MKLFGSEKTPEEKLTTDLIGILEGFLQSLIG